jgi:Bax inhibitor 1
LRRFNQHQVAFATKTVGVSAPLFSATARQFSFWNNNTHQQKQQQNFQMMITSSSSSSSSKNGWLKASPISFIRAAGGGSSNNTSSSYSSSSSSVQPNYSPANSSWGSSGSTESTADSITPQVRNHLVRVYNLLTLGVATAGLGCAAMIMTPLGASIPYFIPMFAGLGCLLALQFMPPKNPQARVGLFLAFTTLEGMSIAPFVKMGAMKGVLGSALVLTGAVFAGFTAMALLAPRGKLLALGGPLFGMLLGMIVLSLFNMFYPTYFAHSIILYGGLALFSIMIAYDTQAMIERARCGNGDHVSDATGLFLNMLNIFIRLLQILGRD